MPGEAACRNGVLSRGRARSWVGGVVLAVLCAIVYVPGLWTTPVIDRDEARFAQASRQMLESGDYVVPRVQERARLNKPPLVYWLQSGSVWVQTGGRVERDAIWMYRVPSVVSAMAAVLLTWRLGRSMFDARVGWLAGAMLAVCPLVVFDAHQARADQLLLATTTLAMLAAWHAVSRAWEGREVGWWRVCGMWAAVGLGVLAKGPITPLIVVLAVVSMGLVGRRWRWIGGLRPVVGLVIVTAMVGPWVYLVASRVGFGDYVRIIMDESVGRVGGSKEGHWGPPGMHLVLLAALFWPGSMLTLSGLAAARDRGLRCEADDAGAGRNPAVRAWAWVMGQRPGRTREFFLLMWLVPAWVFFELFGAKLAHYTMPLYPAVALITARHVLAVGRRGPRANVGTWIWAGIGGSALMLVAACGLVYQDAAGGVYSGWPLGIGIAGLGFGLVFAAVTWVRQGVVVRGHLIGIGAAACLAVAAFASLRPVLPGRETSSIIAALDRVAPEWRESESPLISEHREDSMVFATRGRVVRVDPGTAQRLVSEGGAGGPGLMIVRDDTQVLAGTVIARVVAEPFREHGWLIVRRDASSAAGQ